METYTQITLDEWMEWKEDIRRKLAETAGNFVYIGYRLKQIRDSGMYGGAADVFEFAQKEYGLGKSTVSRFIAINERYSEGGNSLELKEEFKGFSSSKLAEMLTLPDSEIELITEKTTIREIRELKSFNSQAEEISGEESGEEKPSEAAGATPVPGRTPLETCLIDFFKDRREILNGVMACMREATPAYKQAAELMAPSGQASHKKGIVFLFLFDWNTGIKYKLMTQPEPVSMDWEAFLNVIAFIYASHDRADVWESFYGGQETVGKPIEEKPKEEEKEPEEKASESESIQGEEDSVATSQQEAETEEKEEFPEALLGQQETEKRTDIHTETQFDGQEAAGGENKEKREAKASDEAVEDHGQAGTPADDAEREDEEAGAGGREGKGDPGSREACEGQGEEENRLKTDFCEIRIRNAMGQIEACMDAGDWYGVAEKAGEIVEVAQDVMKMQEGRM